VALQPPRAGGVARAVVRPGSSDVEAAVLAERQDGATARRREVGAAAEEHQALTVLLVEVQPGPLEQRGVYFVSQRLPSPLRGRGEPRHGHPAPSCRRREGASRPARVGEGREVWNGGSRTAGPGPTRGPEGPRSKRPKLAWEHSAC